MKKIISVFCVWLVLALILGSLPLVQAQTATGSPGYNESFFLSVHSEQQKEFTPADFPLVEKLSKVYTVKKDPLRTGFKYYLIMVLENPTLSMLNTAKSQAKSYGSVYENYMAYDYADCKSILNLSSYQMELEVGEIADLQVTGYMLPETINRVNSILFTVDPEIVDETALVKNGYQEWGLSHIYADENPITANWYNSCGAMGNPKKEISNQVSTLHSYIGTINETDSWFEVIDTLIKQSGVVKAQLCFSEVVLEENITPISHFSLDGEGVVSLQNGKGLSTVITALQPGETTITVTLRADGRGTATKTCVVTVKENISYTSLNKTVVAVPLGETVDLRVNELCLSQSKYQQVGAFVYVNHNEVTYEDFCKSVEEWAEGAFPLAMYQEDHQFITYGSDWWEFHHYNGDKDSSYFNEVARKRVNTQSPVGEYLIVANSQQTQGELLESLWDLDVTPREWVYARVSDPPTNAQWTSEDPEIATVTNTNAYGLSVTVEGKQAGETQVNFTYSDGEKTVTATCFVKVYEPNWPISCGLGDTCADGVINAKDALAVLRFAVHPHLHFGTITKENIMEYEELVWKMNTAAEFGDVNGDERIDAKDALEILKYAVGKITKFPVEDTVLPTEN